MALDPPSRGTAGSPLSAVATVAAAASPPGVERRLGAGDPWCVDPSVERVVMKVSSPDLVLASEGVPMLVPVAGDGEADAGADATPSVMAALA